MKKYALMFLGTLLSLTVFGQEQKLETAFKQADISFIKAHLNQKIEIIVEDDTKVYSNQEASAFLDTFFKKYPVADFKIIHKGNSKEGNSFAVATYTSKQKNFRTTVTFKNEQGDFRINSLNFSEE